MQSRGNLIHDKDGSKSTMGLEDGPPFLSVGGKYFVPTGRGCASGRAPLKGWIMDVVGRYVPRHVIDQRKENARPSLVPGP